MILPLTSDAATLETAGGKGANLAFLAQKGYPVPPGFIITTDAYRAFLAENTLQARIIAEVASQPVDDPAALEALSGRIRAWFSGGNLPPGLEDSIRQAYAGLGAPPVAVRSSATAEDLPGLSFAGQQDTFLNVVGAAAVVKAVVACWSSLWTARAIGYRARNRIDQDGVALAVVVQAMIPSEAAGVLFTADPVSGLRTQAVIEATLGLGEALVSGRVDPDRYIVDLAAGEIASLALGAKAIAIHGQDSGGTVTLRQEAGQLQALPDEQILSLARLGKQVMADYGSPQDIEWALAGGKLYLLQSRPVTALFPLPVEFTPDDLRVTFSFGAVQGMLDPLTPLGQDAIRMLFTGMAGILGYKTNYETLGAFRVAGERLWVDITPILKNSFGRTAARGVSSVIEPAIGQALDLILDDPRLLPTRRGIRLAAARRLARLFVPVLLRFPGLVIDPDRGRERGLGKAERILASVLARNQPVEGDWRSRLAQRVKRFYLLRDSFSSIGRNFLPPTAGGVALFNIINQMATNAAVDEGQRQEIVDLSLQISRGMPHNATTEMGLYLWRVAQAIRADPPSAARFALRDPAGLAADYLAGRLPPAAQQALAGFMEQYGFRGLAEIDLGRPRWREDPTQVMETLLGYLGISDPAQAPDAAFERAAQAAKAAIPRLAEALRQTPSGWRKAFFVRHAAPRMRALAGLRETPKFFIVRVMGFIRQGLLESGHDLAAAGWLDRPDDVFFLYFKELEALARGESQDWKALVAAHRENYDREKQRRQVPRLLLSDGRAFYEGVVSAQPAKAGEIIGTPVSPGVVEGAARVVTDPGTAQLAKGEILVCPGTDPSWTPLFQTAGGLVMEVGGLMTHGAVVAREYGIPAVVGVDRATERIKTGQRLRVNGSTGQVSLVDAS